MLSRILRLKAVIGILTPIVAILMAFVVSGLIILIFITTYTLTDDVLVTLKEKGIPAEVVEKLHPLKHKEFTQKDVFQATLAKTIDEPAYVSHIPIITKHALVRENPIRVFNEIFKAALKDRNGWGNVLYRATPLIFTGLAVAFAFQCGLFNIGGEGQMIMGGFAITWVGFTLTGLPWFLHIPLCVLAGIFAGGLWGAIPGYLKAKRGVHEVVTTIMLNWIAVAFTQYLTMAFKPPDSWIPHTYEIAKSARLSRLWMYLNPMGIEFPKSNLLNTCIFLAIFVAIAAAFILKRTKLGYEIRAVGFNPTAAESGGISVAKNTVLAMAISGGVAGLAGVNQVMGYKYRFRYGFFEGMGFDGIGVAFIGRNSPLGVVLAAVLFGILDQGGLAIDVSTRVPREIVLVLKAIILIFVVVATEITKRLMKTAQKREEAGK
jgi:simple sugar transport system permease protein